MSSVGRVLEQMLLSESQEVRVTAKTSTRSVVSQIGVYAIMLGYLAVPLGIALVMAEIPAGSFRLWEVISLGWYLLSSFPLMVWTMKFRTRVSSWSRGKSPADRVVSRLVVWGASELALTGVLLEVLMYQPREHHVPFPLVVVPGIFLVAIVVLHPVAIRVVLPRLTQQ